MKDKQKTFSEKYGFSEDQIEKMMEALGASKDEVSFLLKMSKNETFQETLELFRNMRLEVVQSIKDELIIKMGMDNSGGLTGLVKEAYELALSHQKEWVVDYFKDKFKI